MISIKKTMMALLKLRFYKKYITHDFNNCDKKSKTKANRRENT